MIKQARGAVLCLCPLIALCGIAQTCTWNGAASGYWDDGANWSTGAAPQAGDDVVINTWINNSSPLLTVILLFVVTVFQVAYCEQRLIYSSYMAGRQAAISFSKAEAQTAMEETVDKIYGSEASTVTCASELMRVIGLKET